MTLRAGTRLGPYEILGAVGAGGMGEVLRARDTQLGREVAIKVLPEAFADDPDRLARFSREAQTLASLNHPNIATIHGVEEVPNPAGPGAGSRALVMELVEGEDLSAPIARGPIPLAEALPIARQIAEALEAAHEQGIVHRDLKPANIKVRTDGRVKVLDFGLAKAMEPAGASANPNVSHSPTLTHHVTSAGMIVGTARYMSPEQARGKGVDKRADVWAFGAVLYEMLSGRQAFTGDTTTDIIAAVVTRDPDWTALPPSTPAAIRELLIRCLDKDPRRRLRDIGDARFVLESAGASSGVSALADASVAKERSRRPWPWMAATAICAIAAVALAVYPRAGQPRLSDDNGFELAIAAPVGTEFQVGSNSGNVIVSSDGTKVAFVATSAKGPTLWVRSLADDDARPLSGTENASYPFWSPDGKHLGFFANGKLKTVDVAGGLPEVVADAPIGRGGSWADDGFILFTPVGGGTVHRVSSTGGEAKAITKLDSIRAEDAHYWPSALPGGSSFLFFARSTQPENSGIYLGHVDGSAPPQRVLASLSSGMLATEPGTGATFLMWVREDELLAQPFDTGTGKLSGEARRIASGVRVESSQRLTFASVSRTGVVAWAPANAANAVLSLYDRAGRRLRALDVPPGKLDQPALSPDGRRLAFLKDEKGVGAVFVHDLRSGATRQVSTSPNYSEQPTWSPDGRSLLHVSNDDGRLQVFRVPLDEGARPGVVPAPNNQSEVFETLDHRYLFYTGRGKDTGPDAMVMPLFGPENPITLSATPAIETILGASADGKLLLITSGQSGRSAVIRRVMSQGGSLALGGAYTLPEDALSIVRLRPDGREVFYAGADGWLKSLSLTPTGDSLTLGAPQVLFKLPLIVYGAFSPSSDGQRFVIAETPFAAGQTLKILTNWDTRLAR